jgi:hypothetical protein
MNGRVQCACLPPLECVFVPVLRTLSPLGTQKPHTLTVVLLPDHLLAVRGLVEVP